MTNQQRKARLGELQRAFAAENVPVCIVLRAGMPQARAVPLAR